MAKTEIRPFDGILNCYKCGQEPLIQRDEGQWFIHCPDCALSFLFSKKSRYFALLIWNEMMKHMEADEKREAKERRRNSYSLQRDKSATVTKV